MAIRYVQRPFTIATTNGSSATTTEETGSTSDGRIVALRPTRELFAAEDLPGLAAYLGDWRRSPL